MKRLALFAALALSTTSLFASADLVTTISRPQTLVRAGMRTQLFFFVHRIDHLHRSRHRTRTRLRSNLEHVFKGHDALSNVLRVDGDLTGQFITATVTRTNFAGFAKPEGVDQLYLTQTSELGRAIEVR
jgi:hypothetical protein